MLSLSTCFFFNDTATTEIYTLSLHDALPICARSSGSSASSSSRRTRSARCSPCARCRAASSAGASWAEALHDRAGRARSEEHTSELQSRQYLVCRLLLEKKTKTNRNTSHLCT